MTRDSPSETGLASRRCRPIWVFAKLNHVLDFFPARVRDVLTSYNQPVVMASIVFDTDRGNERQIAADMVCHWSKFVFLKGGLVKGALFRLAFFARIEQKNAASVCDNDTYGVLVKRTVGDRRGHEWGSF